MVGCLLRPAKSRITVDMKTIEEEFPPEDHHESKLDLADAYTRLRARAVEMEKGLHSVITNDHESKEAFIARVREIIFPSARP